MYIDLTSPDSVQVELWGLTLYGNIIYGTSMKDLLKEITLITGRMHRPPVWSQKVK
jgi:hypothetical protein